MDLRRFLLIGAPESEDDSRASYRRTSGTRSLLAMRAQHRRLCDRQLLYIPSPNSAQAHRKRASGDKAASTRAALTPSGCSLELGQLCIHHIQEHRQPAQQAEHPESADQRQWRHDPPLPPGEAHVACLRCVGLDRVTTRSLPGSASERPPPRAASRNGGSAEAQCVAERPRSNSSRDAAQVAELGEGAGLIANQSSQPQPPSTKTLDRYIGERSLL